MTGHIDAVSSNAGKIYTHTIKSRKICLWSEVVSAPGLAQCLPVTLQGDWSIITAKWRDRTMVWSAYSRTGTHSFFLSLHLPARQKTCGRPRPRSARLERRPHKNLCTDIITKQSRRLVDGRRCGRRGRVRVSLQGHIRHGEAKFRLSLQTAAVRGQDPAGSLTSEQESLLVRSASSGRCAAMRRRSRESTLFPHNMFEKMQR